MKKLFFYGLTGSSKAPDMPQNKAVLVGNPLTQNQDKCYQFLLPSLALVPHLLFPPA